MKIVDQVHGDKAWQLATDTSQTTGKNNSSMKTHWFAATHLPFSSYSAGIPSHVIFQLSAGPFSAANWAKTASLLEVFKSNVSSESSKPVWEFVVEETVMVDSMHGPPRCGSDVRHE